VDKEEEGVMKEVLQEVLKKIEQSHDVCSEIRS
jgi:hypothetical protein